MGELLASAQAECEKRVVVEGTLPGEMVKKKPSGGYKQQLHQARQEEEQEEKQEQGGEDQQDQHPEVSNFAKVFLQKWAWGKISTPEVQALARAAYQDGLQHTQVLTLASIGSWGKYPGNMQRDLLRAVGSGCELGCCASEFPLLLQAQRETWVSTLVSMLLPHKLFAKIFHERPGAFQASILGGDVSNIRSFWTSMQNHPIVASRPELRGRLDLLQVIPIGLHGDGVSYMQLRAGGKSLEVLSWSSLLSRGPTRANSFLIFLAVKSVLKETGFGRSWPQVWKVLAWSFTALSQGIWPQKDWKGAEFEDQESVDFLNKGKPLANGFSAVLFVLKADIDFLANHFKLNHPSSNSPCSLCQADRTMSSRPWTDCRSTAAWRQTCWIYDSWKAQHPDSHPFFKIPGAGIDLVFPDLMHVKHLGVDLGLLGSALMWLSKHYLPGNTAENLNFIWGYIKQWFKDPA